MTDDSTSAGDPEATLRLLWRHHLAGTVGPRRGPRRALDVEAVVSAAVAVADDQGLPALTMRSLALKLGTRPMSVYTYVPGRAELLDLMLDDAYLRMERTDTASSTWQERVRAVADDNWMLLEHHPWVAHVSTLRPPLGPGQVVKYEHELAAFAGSGFDDVTTDAALTHVLSFVRATARDAADARTAQLASGNDQQWWEAVGPLLAKVLDAEQYPLATRIGTTAGAANASAHDPRRAYTFGLDLMLDALTHLASTTENHN